MFCKLQDQTEIPATNKMAKNYNTWLCLVHLSPSHLLVPPSLGSFMRDACDHLEQEMATQKYSKDYGILTHHYLFKPISWPGCQQVS